MQTYGVKSPLLLVALPEHVSLALACKKVSLEEIGNELTMLYKVIKSGTVSIPEQKEKFRSFLKNILSDHDVTDVDLTNRLVDEALLGSPQQYRDDNLNEITGFSLAVIANTYKERSGMIDLTEFENFMSDKGKDLNAFILNNDITSVVEYAHTQSVLFVIVKQGFTNYKRFKNRDFPSFFRKTTLNSLFKMYDEKTVRETPFFQEYVRLSGN